jgi:hypothetical protein
VVEVYNEQRVLKAMLRYAAFDKSDPFTLARALCHFHQGLLGYTEDGKEGWYDAEEHSTFANGVATVKYTNIVRP